MKDKTKFKIFPWTKDVQHKLFSGFGFDRDKQLMEAMQLLLQSVKEEANSSVEENDIARCQKLCIVIEDYLLHLYIVNFENQISKACNIYVSKLLSYMLDLCILLSEEYPSSLYIDKAVTFLFLFYKENLTDIVHTLFQCFTISKRYKEVSLPLLRRCLKTNHDSTLDHKTFLKFMLLLRLWKVFTLDKREKNEILVTGANMKVEPEFDRFFNTHYICETPLFPNMTPKEIADFLLTTKFPPKFLKQVKKHLLKNDEIGSSLVNLPTKTLMDKEEIFFYIDTGQETAEDLMSNIPVNSNMILGYSEKPNSIANVEDQLLLEKENSTKRKKSKSLSSDSMDVTSQNAAGMIDNGSPMEVEDEIGKKGGFNNNLELSKNIDFLSCRDVLNESSSPKRIKVQDLTSIKGSKDLLEVKHVETSSPTHSEISFNEHKEFKPMNNDIMKVNLDLTKDSMKSLDKLCQDNISTDAMDINERNVASDLIENKHVGMCLPRRSDFSLNVEGNIQLTKNARKTSKGDYAKESSENPGTFSTSGISGESSGESSEEESSKESPDEAISDDSEKPSDKKDSFGNSPKTDDSNNSTKTDDSKNSPKTDDSKNSTKTDDSKNSHKTENSRKSPKTDDFKNPSKADYSRVSPKTNHSERMSDRTKETSQNLLENSPKHHLKITRSPSKPHQESFSWSPKKGIPLPSEKSPNKNVQHNDGTEDTRSVLCTPKKGRAVSGIESPLTPVRTSSRLQLKKAEKSVREIKEQTPIKDRHRLDSDNTFDIRSPSTRSKPKFTPLKKSTIVTVSDSDMFYSPNTSDCENSETDNQSKLRHLPLKQMKLQQQQQPKLKNSPIKLSSTKGTIANDIEMISSSLAVSKRTNSDNASESSTSGKFKKLNSKGNKKSKQLETQSLLLKLAAGKSDRENEKFQSCASDMSKDQTVVKGKNPTKSYNLRVKRKAKQK